MEKAVVCQMLKRVHCGTMVEMSSILPQRTRSSLFHLFTAVKSTGVDSVERELH